jgi:hypothetical protein
MTDLMLNCTSRNTMEEGKKVILAFFAYSPVFMGQLVYETIVK